LGQFTIFCLVFGFDILELGYFVLALDTWLFRVLPWIFRTWLFHIAMDD